MDFSVKGNEQIRDGYSLRDIYHHPYQRSYPILLNIHESTFGDFGL